MQNKSTVAKYLKRYLDHRSRRRDQLRDTLTALTERLPETVIFGGMIREVALGNTRQFSSDVDIVTQSSSDEIIAAIAEFSPIRNKFGGFRFNVGTQLFDIWSFDDTWAFRKGLVSGSSFEDILKTTFFNLDAAAYHLQHRKIYCTEFYIKAVKNRVLDLNLEKNPAPSSMVRRAIRLAIENSLFITPRLGEYILRNFDSENTDDMSSMYVEALRRFLAADTEQNFSFVPQATLFNHLPEQLAIPHCKTADTLYSSKIPAY